MALFTQVFDDSLKRRRFVAYPGFKDTVTLNSGAATANFTVSGVTIDAVHAIDAWVDGRLQDEGNHWNRDVGNNRLVFTANVNTNSTVRIRVYLK